jgi:hypothetical protein
VIFSILIAPSLSTKFNAIAGRTLAGGAAGEECQCGLASPPDCYYDGTTQQCNEGATAMQQPTEKQSEENQSDSKDLDAGSVGLFFLTALYFLRRLI